MAAVKSGDLRSFSPGVWLVTGLLLAVPGGDAAFAQESPNNRLRYEVRLVDRSVIPDPKIENERYGVLQFYDVPTEAQHRALADLGVLLADFIPNLAYTASVPNSVKKQDLLRLNARAYFPLKRNDKLDPELAGGRIPPWALGSDGRARLLVHVFPGLRAGEAKAALREVGATVFAYSELLQSLTVQIASARVGRIADIKLVRFVRPVPPPVAPTNDQARSIIGTSDIQPAPWGTDSLVDGLTGNGVRLGIWDLGPDISHPDLSAPRVTVVEPNPPCWFGPNHPTWVAGTMAGDGSSSSANGGTAYQWAGMAPEADVFEWSAVNSSCWSADADYEMGPAVAQYHIVLANNSWNFPPSQNSAGCSLFGDYNWAIPYDGVVRTTDLGLVFSAGNERNTPDEAACVGVLPGGGYRTVCPPATAKNVITVGAIDKSNPSMMYFNGSWGPTSDGRLKPDVVAVGVNVKTTSPPNGYLGSLDGTSLAAPGVTGTAALLVERYRQLNSGQDPKTALTKAILLNTADDLGNLGPDFQFGYGRVNAPEADRTLKDGRYLIGSVAHGGTAQFSLNVPALPDSTCTIKAMLAYTDMEGVSWITQQNLVNDLDLTLVEPSGCVSNCVHYPLTLDPLNPGAPAVEAANHRDNVEQVVVDNAPPGVWTAVVSGLFVPAPPGVQEFALTWKGTCFCITRPANMTAWYPLDEGTGATTVLDISGNGHNGTPKPLPVGLGGPIPGAPNNPPAVVGGSLYFPDFSTYVQVPNTPPLNIGSGDFTIDAWVLANGGLAAIVDKFDDTTHTGYKLYLDPVTSGGTTLYFSFSDGSTSVTVPSILPIPFHEWHHVAVTVKRSLTVPYLQVLFYVDGTQQGGVSVIVPVGTITNGLDLFIGGFHPPTLGVEIGIDELELFNRALGPQEIKDIFKAGAAGKCK